MNRIDVSLNFLWLLIAILAVRGERGCDETQLLQHRMPGGKDESQLLAAVAEAYESKRGLIISGTGTPQDIQPDHSGSVLRSDFPPMIATYIGLIFDPSKHPEVLCSFVVDGGTDHRKSNSGSLCGWAFPQFKKSTRCDFPPEEYVQRYGLKPMADVKQYGAEAVRVWAITQASCSFTTIDDSSWQRACSGTGCVAYPRKTGTSGVRAVWGHGLAQQASMRLFLKAPTKRTGWQSIGRTRATSLETGARQIKQCGRDPVASP